MKLYDRIVDPDLTVRRVNIAAIGLLKENEIPEDGPEQLNLFVDYDALEKEREEEREQDAKERRMQEAALAIQRKFGKNAMLKGMNLLEGATTRQRNRQVGGHAADQPGQSSSQPGTSPDIRMDEQDARTDVKSGSKDRKIQ